MKHSPSFRDLPPSELARFLERALDASSSGVVITDPRKPDNPIVYVNPAFERITGYPAEEVLGYNCRFLQGEDREQAALEEVRTAVREEHDCRVVLRNHRKDGAPFWIELHISPVHDEKGRLVNFVGVQNDVSERRGLEDALRKREEQLRLAMRAGHIGMCEWNARADQLTCSEGFAEIFGLPAGSRNPVYGDLLSRVHPEDRGALQSARTAAALDRDSYETEYRVVHSGGGIRWVAERGRIYRDARGCVERTIGIVQDVTEHKLAEEERNALLDRERQAKEWAERAVQRMFVLEQAGAALSASLDYDETLDRITDIFVPNLADCCLVDGVDESGAARRLAQVHVDPDKEHFLIETEKRSNDSVSVPEIPETLGSGRSFLIPDTSENLLTEPPETQTAPGPGQTRSSEAPLDTLRWLEPRSYMIVPLVARGRVLGAVTLFSTDPSRHYEKEDLALAEELASRCGLALEGARLYREQSYMARTLQRGLLLQDLPEIPGVEIGLEYLSAGEESEVGGDFYDLIDTHYDGWLCLLGDVSGKGARAATSTALILYALRAVAFRGDKPSMLLSALNEAMLRQDANNQFCTAVCVRLEPEECAGSDVKLTLARGGHPAPLLLHADGSLEELGEAGKAIGVFESFEIEDLAMCLQAGDTLVFYTDGVTEARAPDGAFFGEDRLRSLVQSCAGLGAAETAGHIKDAVLEHKGGNPGDDVAILALQVLEDA